MYILKFEDNKLPFAVVSIGVASDETFEDKVEKAIREELGLEDTDGLETPLTIPRPDWGETMAFDIKYYEYGYRDAKSGNRVIIMKVVAY